MGLEGTDGHRADAAVRRDLEVALEGHLRIRPKLPVGRDQAKAPARHRLPAGGR
jgi:hypothetical protein